MLNVLKERVKSNRKLYKVIAPLGLFRRASWTKIRGDKKKYPKVVQMPLTYKCNSACVMCNIWNMDFSNEMPVDEFAKYMKDPLFKKVEVVGINGGEPTTISNLEEYAREILTLPKLKALNIISNAFMVKRLLNKLEIIYGMCKEKGVSFHVSISLDGYKDIHNKVRGKHFAWDRTVSAIEEIMRNRHKYCDSFDAGCTVVKQNVNNLVELDVWANKVGLDIKYRLGIENKRIESDKLRDQYSILYDDLRQSAKEFFHSRINKPKSFYNRFKYYSIYYFLDSKEPKRLLGCAWKDEGVTVDSRGDIYYCAVASEKIGSLREAKGEEIFFDDKNINYRKSIVEKHCNNCIHDYVGKIEVKNLIVFIRYLLKEKFYTKLYKLKASFL